MKKTAVEIYALAVCFVAVVCFAISLGVGIYGIIQVANPDFTMNSYQYNWYQSNDSYWDQFGARALCASTDTTKPQRPSETELTKKRLDAFSIALKCERREGAQSIVRQVIIMLIDAVVFLVHWIISRRARASVAA